MRNRPFPPSCQSTGLDVLDEDFPPGFTEVAQKPSLMDSGTNRVSLTTDNRDQLVGLPTISEPNLGSPMPASYHDALLAHLPVYTDHVSPKEGVIPVVSDRYKDVTIR